MTEVAAALAALAVAAPGALAATSTHGIKVSPTSVKRGATVRLFGSVGKGCAKGDTVTIYSKALKGATKHDFAGVPAVFTKVGRHHRFSRRLTLSKMIKPRRYRIGGSCGGGNLGRTSLRVTK